MRRLFLSDARVVRTWLGHLAWFTGIFTLMMVLNLLTMQLWIDDVMQPAAQVQPAAVAAQPSAPTLAAAVAKWLPLIKPQRAGVLPTRHG